MSDHPAPYAGEPRPQVAGLWHGPQDTWYGPLRCVPAGWEVRRNTSAVWHLPAGTRHPSDIVQARPAPVRRVAWGEALSQQLTVVPVMSAAPPGEAAQARVTDGQVSLYDRDGRWLCAVGDDGCVPVIA